MEPKETEKKHSPDCNLIKNKGIACTVDHAPGYKCDFYSCTCSPQPIEPQEQGSKKCCDNCKGFCTGDMNGKPDCNCHPPQGDTPQEDWNEEFNRVFHGKMIAPEYKDIMRNFIREVRTQAIIQERQRLARGLKEKLLKKARETDYADRTEYDEALEIALSITNKDNE